MCRKRHLLFDTETDGLSGEFAFDKNFEDQYATYLSLDSLENASQFILGRIREMDEQAMKERLERMQSYPIQLSKVEFSERDRRKYNIDDREADSVYRVVSRATGEDLLGVMLFVGSSIERVSEALKSLNAGGRYTKVTFLFPSKYTREDKKKYRYLKGDYRYERREAVLDREEMRLVWKAESQFVKSPCIHGNVMSMCGVYTYIPTMEKIFEKSYGTIIETECSIIIEKEWNKSAVAIDKTTGKVYDIP